MKKKLVILSLCILFISGCSNNTDKSVSLVQLNSRDYGNSNHAMKIVEIEHNPKTSKLKLTYKKMGSSVGASMFIMRGFYEVAKARGAEYFINLKEWDDPNGGQIFIAGFTNTKDANIHDEFGKEFSLKNDHGQARGYMSVSQCNLLWGQSPTSTTNNFSSTSMQVKQGNFFLVKKGNDYAAVKLTRKISKGDGGYKYVWYWQNDGSGSFTNKNAIKGEGEVFEKYLRTRKSATSCTVKDNGGSLYIKCKNIKIQWSLNRWIYLSSRGNLEIALINKKKIEDIDYLDKNIKWKTNRKAISQGKDTQYLKGFSQVFKTKNYAIDGALDMKYSFVVCDSKGTVLNKIANSTTTFLPKMGAGGYHGVRNKTNGYNYSLVVSEQDDDKGIFIFDIIIRYKSKIYQAKIKKLISFDGKKTEIFSFNMNDYVKDPKVLKKLAQYFAEQYNRSMNPPHPLDIPPVKCTNLVSEEPIDINSQDPVDIRNRAKLFARLRPVRKENIAPQFKKDSLKKYFSDEAKGLNIKDSTNVERIKRGLQPILFLFKKPITWEVNPERGQNLEKSPKQ